MNRRVPYIPLAGLLIITLLASACVAVPSISPNANPAAANSEANAVAPAQSAASAPMPAPASTPGAPAKAQAVQETATPEPTRAAAVAGAAAEATQPPSATATPGATATPFQPRLNPEHSGPPVIPSRTPGRLPDAAAAGRAVDDFATKYQSFGGFDGILYVEVGGKVALDKAYGYADLPQKRPMALDTRFWIFDLSSTLTAAAVLTLQEQGKLSVTDLVCKYVPECPTAWKDLTIRHLLTRTDGLPDYTKLPGSGAWRSTPLSLEQVVGKFRDAPLDFAPGRKWHFNRSGYVLASYVIEKASGMSYESYLKSALLQPLGMADTGLSGPGPNVALGNAGVPAPHEFAANGYGASGLYSTVADLTRWAHALMGEGGLSDNVRNLMLADDVALTPALADGWYGYGLGGGVNRGRLEWGENGFGEGYRNTVYFEPEAKLLVIGLIASEKVNLESFFTALEKKLFAD